MRVPYRPSPACIERYYLGQVGGAGIPVFTGPVIQRGYGLGSVFASLFRTVSPLLKSGAKLLGRHAFRTGARIMTDVAEGENVKTAAKNRLRETGSELLNTIMRRQTGSGRVLKRRKGTPRVRPSLYAMFPPIKRGRTQTQVQKSRKRPRQRTDIFDQ